mmetsp:Transcript_28585/g.53786  ORF Transcript_28585/g.53786 Transcript_28585/m.53786 type:complete len:219 (+) Transcript_28585:3857-4513(+)
MAGRSTPRILRSRTTESIINAPVLPQLTTPSASPLRTDSKADHIDVVFERITSRGLSSIDTTSEASRMSTRPSRLRLRATSFSNSSLGPCRMNAMSGFFFAECEMPATTAAGPRSPPMASTEMTVRPLPGFAVFAKPVMRAQTPLFMLRLRPDRRLLPSQRLHGRCSGRKRRKRGVDASVRRSFHIRLGSLQPGRHVHGGCCGAISILCSAGQPCRNL